jgi:alpha-L-rhamnosidase
MGTSLRQINAPFWVRVSRFFLGILLIASVGSSRKQAPSSVESSSSSLPASRGSAQLSSLRVDMLSEPIGLDDVQPMFSWKIQDASEGARQTAYRIRVATRAFDVQSSGPEGGSAPDLLWDSGKVESAQSTEVPYSGKPLEASRRYFWRVESWDKDGRPYPASEVSHWETGLMNTDSWRSQWIGYEQPEDKSIRESDAQWITNVPLIGTTVPVPQPSIPSADSRHDFKFILEIRDPIARAELLTTGQDTAGAWINGRLVIEEAPLPPWHQTPWGNYVRRDITRDLHPGANTVAIEVKRFLVPEASVGGEVNWSISDERLHLCAEEGRVIGDLHQ